jgi:thiosulfate sulfurtransferase
MTDKTPQSRKTSDFPSRKPAEMAAGTARQPGMVFVPGARGLSAEALDTLLKMDAPIQLLDVRRKPALAASGITIKGAKRIEPERVSEALSQIDRHCLVVAVCVHGHEVSQGAAAALRAAGFDACFFEGGLEAIQRQNLLPLVRIDDAEGQGHD